MMVARRTAYTMTASQLSAVAGRGVDARPAVESLPGSSILHDIELFLKAHPHVSGTRLGREAVNDPRMLTDLRRGATMGQARAERIRKFMREYAG